MIIFNSHKTIETLTQFLPENPIIVEAGAFDGKDTIKMMQRWPQSTIHAFEPLPEIFTRLHANTHNLPNVHRYPYALSNKNGNETFYISENPTKPGVASQANSLHAPKDRLKVSPLIFPRTTTVKTVTLASWAHTNNITKINLLWLDTQGHELPILQAAHDFLPNIDFILAEVSFIESYHNQPLYADVVTWMERYGFTHIGRDFADQPKSFFGNALFKRSVPL